jgi:hypothetical protein
MGTLLRTSYAFERSDQRSLVVVAKRGAKRVSVIGDKVRARAIDLSPTGCCYHSDWANCQPEVAVPVLQGLVSQQSQV